MRVLPFKNKFEYHKKIIYLKNAKKVDKFKKLLIMK